MVVIGDSEGGLQIWETQGRKLLHAIRGHNGAVCSVAISPDGKRIASGGEDKTIKIWDVNTGHESLSITGHEGVISGVIFSQDGKRIISSSHDHTLKLWDAVTGREQMKYEGHMDEVWSVTVSRDGKYIVSGSADKTTRIWDAKTGKLLKSLWDHIGGVKAVTFSPDGARIVTACEDIVKVWSAETGQELLTISQDTNVESLAFSPNGETIAACTDDGNIKLWRTTRLDGGYDTPQKQKAELARRTVNRMYEQYLFYHEVINQLLADKSLTMQIREMALRIAHVRQEDVATLCKEIWRVIRLPDQDAETYRLALRMAEKANQMEPDEWLILHTLGVARYRVGAYQKAVESLSQSNNLRQAAVSEVLHTSKINLKAMSLAQRIREEEFGFLFDLEAILKLELALKAENPQFEGRIKSCRVEGGKIVDVDLSGVQISDISALKGLPIEHLNLSGTQISNINALKGIPLKSLYIGNTGVNDISVLANMPLIYLDLSNCPIKDLSTLKETSLQYLVLPNEHSITLNILKNMQRIFYIYKPDKKPVLLMNFNEKFIFKRDGQYVVRDLSSGENYGIIHGAKLKRDEANSLEFDGVDDYVNCGDMLNPGTNSYSVSLWFKASEKIGHIASKGNLHKYIDGWSIIHGVNTIQVRAHHMPNFRKCGQKRRGCKPDKWYHVVMVINKANLTFRGYLNGSNNGWHNSLGANSGKLEAAGDFSTSAPLIIGSDSNGMYRFKGLIADVRIYNYALSVAEVAAIYHAGAINKLVETVRPQASWPQPVNGGDSGVSLER